ncbi:unnamed protein product [Rotaria magnacalcarata]|uniref:Uncharacterized protein n=1 Tax=Rotaria magnacalcarata TaxID=392030 RepID=A0A815Z8E4_9BILA|nr:unnamed protein product [Rotaria magnacalcarata]
MEELIILYKNTTGIDRNLYEIIIATNPVKAYIDFEYYVDNNLEMQNHYIGSNCCLKIFHYLLNFTHHTHYQSENHIDLALEEFLVLEAFMQSRTSALTTENKNEVLNSINDHLKHHCIFQNKLTPINKSNSLTTISISKNNHNNFQHETAAKFIPFIENIIKSDENHQGYIYTCIPGKYNKNLLFFNLGGNYRYCPKNGSHHRNNPIAILLDTKKLIYTIRCKDSECNNNVLNWISIQ